MEIVKNKLFYHIQQLGNTPWQIGEEHVIGTSKNPHFAFYDTFSALGLDPTEVCKEYYNFAKEVTFEEIRLRDFQNYPSRYTCLWMIPYTANLQESVKYWFGQLIHLENGSAGCRILGLRCTGKIHYANSLFYLNNYWCGLNDVRISATKYWQGIEALPEAVTTEVLFEGNVIVDHVLNFD